MPGARPRAIRGAASGKPKPLLITETFLCVLRRKAATDADASEASVVNTKRAASAISAGWIKGLAMPEIWDQNTLRMAGNSARARHSNMRGMIPEFELDDVGLARQGRNVREIVCRQHPRAGRLDHVDVAALARRLEQNERLLHNFR